LNKKRKIASILLTLSMAVSIAACSNANTTNSGSAGSTATGGETKTASGAPVTIRFAHQNAPSDENRAKVKEAVDAFAEQNKDKFKLVQEIVAGDEIKSKLRIDAAAKNLPDVFWFFGQTSDASGMVKSGNVLPMDEFFKVSTKTKREDFQEWAWENVKVNGGYYTIPTGAFSGAWFVNKELFQKYNLQYPKTWNDMKELAKTFKQHGIVTLATGSKGGNPSWFHVDMAAVQYSGAFDAIRKTADTWQMPREQYKKALDLFDDLRKAGAFPADTIANGDWGPNFALYNEGKAAIIPAFTWQLTSMKPGIEEKTEIIDIPTVEGGTLDMSKYSSKGGFVGIFINKKSWDDPNKQAAIVDLVDFWSSQEMFETRFYGLGELSTRKEPLNIDESKVPHKILLDIIKRDETRDAYPQINIYTPDANVWADYQSYLDELFTGSITTDQYLDKVQASLDKNKKLAEK
jgi:raffinose/stachyose/melibiose transport system substrate-binding protein